MDEGIADILIVGTGLVGLSLAAGLRGSGLTVTLVDRALAPSLPTPQPDDWDVRIYAISPGSEAFLRELGTWPDPARVQPVYAMEVTGDEQIDRLRFDARDAHASHLASILENRALLDALWCCVRAEPMFRVVAPAACAAVEFQRDGVELTLADGRQLRARLAIAADGGNSWLRNQAGIASTTTPYEQIAVVANFACERDHEGTAFQWFRRDGVLALLPLPGRRCSMVWSASAPLARELLALVPDSLSERVAQASDRKLGALRMIGPPAGFPLQLVRVERLILPRLALVGDAAHNLHPLAGQGVNLGFQDARDLCRVLRERGACADVGEYRLLRRYERSRSEDILAMTLATDGLKRLFNNESRPLSWLRNRGLSMVNRVGPIKQLLVRHALG